MRKSWQVFHDWSILLIYLGAMFSLSLGISQQCGAQLPIHTLNIFFLDGGVLECNFAPRRTVAALFVLFKIKSDLMHPLSGASPLLYVPASVTHGALVAHRHSFASHLCSTSQYLGTVCPSQCLFGTILVTLCLMV